MKKIFFKIMSMCILIQVFSMFIDSFVEADLSIIAYASKHSVIDIKGQKKNEYTDIKRCHMNDIPKGVRRVIRKKCIDNKWYIIEASNRKYIYFKKLPRDFSYQIVDKNLNIFDIGKKKKGKQKEYVLLSVGKDFNFTLKYNSESVPKPMCKVIEHLKKY